MKKLPLYGAVLLGSTLIACGGDPKSESGKPSSLLPPEFAISSSVKSSDSSDSGNSSSSAASNIVNQTIPFHENFDNAGDTSNFFKANYKALNTDSTLPFYFATGGFVDENGNLSTTTSSWITSDENHKLQLGNGRFTIGQTKLSAGTTVQDDKDLPTSWGELDLSKPYRISFCVVEKSGTSNFEIYVDNNTTSGNSSRYGGGNASRILQKSIGSLTAGERFSVTVPTDNGKDIGTVHSFLQFRVASGGVLVMDDLIIEYLGEPHGFTLPECKAETTTPPTPATPPVTPTGLSAIEGDTSLVVSWASAGVGVNYQVSYNTTNDLASATSYAANPVAGNSVQLTDLVNGQQYFVWVKAVNSAGESEFSEPVSASPKAPVGGDTSKAWGFNSFEYTSILEGTSGTSNVKVSTESYDADGLAISLTNGTALRYRLDSNVWNFNGNSFRSSDSRVPAVGETVAELRAYVGVPVVVGRAAEVSFIVKQTGSGQVGKAVIVNQSNQVLLVTEITDNTLEVPLTITLEEGHSTEELRVFYSREGTGGGGMDLVSLRKSYADSPLEEEEEPASSSSSSESSAASETSSSSVTSSSEESSASSSSSESSVSESSSSVTSSEESSASSSSSVASSEESSSAASSSTGGTGGTATTWGFDAAVITASVGEGGLFAAAPTGDQAVVAADTVRSVDGLNYYATATSLRYRVESNVWNFNGSSFSSNNRVLPAVGEVLDSSTHTPRMYIGVPVTEGAAVSLSINWKHTSSSVAYGRLALVDQNNLVLKVIDANSGNSNTLTLDLANGHTASEVRIIYSRENGGSSGGLDIEEIVKTYF